MKVWIYRECVCLWIGEELAMTPIARVRCEAATSRAAHWLSTDRQRRRAESADRPNRIGRGAAESGEGRARDNRANLYSRRALAI